MRFGAGDEDQSNVEDRRGQSRGGGGGGPGIRLGLGGIVVVGVLSLVLRRNLFTLLGSDGSLHGTSGTSGTGATDPAAAQARAAHEEGLKKTAVGSFNDAQRQFRSLLAGGRGPAYRDATLVLFWDETRSGCGAAGAEMGPFYCPADNKVYIDLGFYDELAQRFKAPGDFAQAYVIAHEVGHHVQTLLGTEAKMRSDQAKSPGAKNELSVRLELQADCYAGAWGHSAQQRGLLDGGDIDEGITAAGAIGDDRIQKMAGRRVSPESFTHGSSEMRVRWFRRGFQSGRLEDCDTFAARTL